ncbi:nicotinamide-nucleotide amidase [Agromyces terreus]|uniref:Nicotinamide-nucleotide amidase n=1 Tax=Agromyces terreus TaxID=424795 RepID=A0A9X2GZA5_9MICO|nr:nicotinamide-nucleotide amidohydrolase family protein [Agromyces terreus]MCP2371865.1 nicotinamide-nucleotide amidase [Agromyces terreus]
MPRDDRTIEARAAACARAAVVAGMRVVVAESLTSGAIAGALGRAADASEWFAGGIVAYRPETKQRVLGVQPGPVVTAAAARQMALGALSLTGAQAVAAVTGAGGPGPEEGRPAGTVFLASGTDRRGIEVVELHLPGDPAEVVAATVVAALEALERALRGG